jgi:CrcB protein
MSGLDFLWVFLGGGAGSVLRWSVGRVAGERYHGDFPVGTFVINVSGAFVIGFLSVLFGVDWHDRFGTPLKSGILTGVLGGYTTFSTMQLDAANLSDKSRRGMALLYIVLSVSAGLAAAALGAFLARLGG